LKIIFLGTNGWYDTDTGNTICTLIKAKSCNLILDAGFGICKIDRYIDKYKPTYIFLSHLHLDHLVGLHALAKFSFGAGVKIFVPKGTIPYFRRFLAQPFTIPPKGLSFKVDIKAAALKMHLGGLDVRSLELVHSSRCLGYRFKLDNKVITYCTDTGPCKNALKLAQGADLLITECALKKGQSDQGWPHLDPTQAAVLAKKSQVRKLVLTHFDAYNYKTKKERQIAQSQARMDFPNSFAAFDGMQLKI